MTDKETKVNRKCDGLNTVSGFPVERVSVKRDRALYRLLLDLEDLQDSTGEEENEPWFEWAKRMAEDLRTYLGKKGYVI